MIQPPLGLTKEQMEISITSASGKWGFIPQSVVFCPHSPAGCIGFPAFKSYVCKHPSYGRAGILVQEGNVEADRNEL